MKIYKPRVGIVNDLMAVHKLDVNQAEKLDVFHQIYQDMERGSDTRTAVMNILKTLMKELET
jgi:hypothetical protein